MDVAAAVVPRRVARWALALALSWLAGCASLPPHVVRTPSSAIVDVGTSPLARVGDASTPPHARHLSGIRLLPDAREAFALRLALVRAARASVDVQYYFVAHDDSGGQFLNELQQAARRGVRVRVLLDDLHAGDADPVLRRLSSLPGADVRLFNPLPSRASAWSTRVVLSLHEAQRINRRMHNKLLVADNTFAVAGGRNIADEYFLRGDASHFIDMDTLASGPVVGELSALFDRYWNSEHAYPIESLGGHRDGDDGEVSGDGGDGAGAAELDEAGVVGELGRGRIEMRFAPVALHADEPSKAGGGSDPTAMDRTLELFASATGEVEIVSPYFVPGRRGMALIRSAADRGVRLSVTTNSLASTDEPLAYWGYARYRAEMLGLGVSLTELSPTGSVPRGHHTSASVGRLHAKVAMVDRRWLLIGSMNMDARSSRSNTELALVVDSPELAAEMTALLQAQWARDHYKLRVAPPRRSPAGPADEGATPPAQIEWVGPSQVHQTEPHVGWWSRLRLGLMSVLVPEDWL